MRATWESHGGGQTERGVDEDQHGHGGGRQARSVLARLRGPWGGHLCHLQLPHKVAPAR